MKRNLVGVDGSSRNPATRRVVAPSPVKPHVGSDLTKQVLVVR